jgi:hypothetical protein
MGEKALWPLVTVLLGLFTAITVMMVAHVDVMAVALVFSLMGNIAGGVISIMLYGKMNKIEANTNGTMSVMQAQNKQLIEHTINSVPLDVK